MAENIQNNEVQQDLSEILKIRREKLQTLQNEGRDPFVETKYEVSHYAADIKENFDALSDAIQKARPASAKGQYIISCSVSATMTPGLKINLKELVRAAK